MDFSGGLLDGHLRDRKGADLPVIPVLFVEVAEGARGAARAFAALDHLLGSSRGRRLFWVFFWGTYRACAERKEGDDPRALCLAEGVVPDERHFRRPQRVEGVVHPLEMEYRAEELPLSTERTEVDYFALKEGVMLMLPMPRGPSPPR